MAYNSSYSGGEDQEDHRLRPAPGQKVCETPFQPVKSKCGGVHHTHRRITVQASQGINMKNN
jgi:hypothetical protein